MATDFHQLIAANRRNSWLLVSLFALFVVVVGGILGYAIGAYSAGPRFATQYALLIAGVALVIALISTAGSYFGGASAILTISGAKPLEKSDDPQFFNVVEEMSLAAGVPMPKIYLINDTAPNAFATGRNPEHGVIAITTGLRSKLSRDELQAVVAHEMSHIRNFDIRFALLMATLVGIIVLLCDMFWQATRWGAFTGGRSRRSGRDRDSGGAAVIVILLLAVLLSIVAPILAKIIEMAFSRQREYLADASAVELTRNPDALASALSRISNDPEVLEVANRATAPLYIVHPIKHFEERASTIFDSHPPIKDRIARLLALTQ